MGAGPIEVVGAAYVLYTCAELLDGPLFAASSKGGFMKKFIIIALLVCIVIVLASCQVGNRQVGMDTIQTFDRYKIIIGDDVIEGKIQTWRDFEDSDVVQIMDVDGTVDLTHYKNTLIVRDPR